MAVTTAGQASTGAVPPPPKTASSVPVPTNKLSLRSKLLFAQAVHHLGAPIGKGVGNNWNNVAIKLYGCPTLSEEEKGLFTEHNCRGFYDDLMAEAGFGNLSMLPDLEKPKAKAHLAMTQYFYMERMKELRATVESQEQQFRQLTNEVDALKSGEGIHNESLMEELRRAVAKAKGEISMESLSEWLPTKDHLRLAAAGTLARAITSTKPTFESIQLKTQLQDSLPISASSTHHSAPAVSATTSPSSTPTPTPSVVVNGEILKPYPTSIRYQSEPTNEVPPLQIQPKKRTESPGISIVGPNVLSSAEVVGIHSGKVMDGKREGSLPKQLPRKDLPGRTQPEQASSQEIGRVRKAATASPSPSVSEHPVPSRPPRLQSVGALASTPAKKHMDQRGNTPITTAVNHRNEPFSPPVSQPMVPVKKEGSPAISGVYTHRKIPVKNAASTPTIARTPSVGEKRSVTAEEMSMSSAKEPEIVPDSQEVPDSQDEAASDRPGMKGHERKASKGDGLGVSPTKSIRTTRKTNQQKQKLQSPARAVKRETEEDDHREVAGSDSDRSELTTPPASPALSSALSPVNRKVKGESDDVDMEKTTSSELSPVMPQKPLTGKKVSRISVKEETEKAAGKRGRKRARGSESGDLSTPAKRPNQKSGNTMSQDELSPAPSPGGSVEYRRADTDDTDGTDTQQKKVRLRSSDMEDEEADAPRRGLKRRMSTRGKPPTIDENSEADDNTSGRGRGSVERSTRPRGNKEGDQSSRRNATSLRSGRSVRTTSDKHQHTNTDDTADEDGSEKAANPPYQPRKVGRPPKHARHTREDSEADTVEDDRGSEKREKSTKQKSRDSRKDAQQLQDENQRESEKDEDNEQNDSTTHKQTFGRTRATRSTANASPTVSSNKAFQSIINPLYEEIVAYKHGPLFLAPVRESDAPGYSKIVKQPMDLKKIKSKIKKGEITSIDEFQRDLWLVFSNAMLYNKPNTEVYRMAQEMQSWCEKKIDSFRELQRYIKHNT